MLITKSAFALGKSRKSIFVVPAKNPVHYLKISSSFKLKIGINLQF